MKKYLLAAYLVLLALITQSCGGGFAGNVSYPGEEYNLFWDITVNSGLFDFGHSGGTDDTDVTGATTINMTDPSATIYSNAGWDFNTVWEMLPGQNDDYPMFQWQND